MGALLLRVLLCLVLVVNGSAQAMGVAHAVAAEQRLHQAAPCHESGGPHAAMEHAMGEHPASGPASHMSNCCKAGVCACTCSPAAAAALRLQEPERRHIVHAVDVAPSTTHYASPALRRLIRPPIV